MFDRLVESGVLLDPFAGSGRIHELRNDFRHTWGVEIEPEWAAEHPCTIVGNALDLPFADRTFSAVITSPTYGNRMADHHEARDDSQRYSYKHTLGRMPHPRSSSTMQWGTSYRAFHSVAWHEVYRVLKRRGKFVLNVKDHYRDHKLVRVVAWHERECQRAGFAYLRHIKVPVTTLRHGANRKRVLYESVMLFVKP